MHSPRFRVWIETVEYDSDTKGYKEDVDPEPLPVEFATEQEAIRAKLLCKELYDCRGMILLICQAVYENVMTIPDLGVQQESAHLLEVLKNGGVE